MYYKDSKSKELGILVKSMELGVDVKESDKVYLEHLKKVMGEFTKTNYGVDLDIPVMWSKRLTRKWGYFAYKMNGYTGKVEKGSLKIVLSYKLYKTENKDIVESIAKHEALHFALFRLGEPHSDGHPHFEGELKRHGLVRTGVTSKMVGIGGKYWVWTCGDCDKVVIKGGKTRKNYGVGYLSRCCGARLKEQGWQYLGAGQDYL